MIIRIVIRSSKPIRPSLCWQAQADPSQGSFVQPMKKNIIQRWVVTIFISISIFIFISIFISIFITISITITRATREM